MFCWCCNWPNKYTMVCFECRTSHKRWHKFASCQHCGEDMAYIGMRLEVPKRNNNKKWERLEKKINLREKSDGEKLAEHWK